MFKTTLAVAAIAAVSACSTTSPELKERKTRNTALQKEAFASTQSVTVNGTSFTIGNIEADDYALARVADKTASYTVNDVETAVGQASG